MKIKPFNSLFAIALAVVAVLGMASCNEKKFHVNGTIGNAADSTLYFENMSLNGPVVVDSVKLSADGTFDFDDKAPTAPEFYRLRIAGQIINIAIDSTETVSIKAEYPGMASQYEVSGSEECSRIKELTLMQMSLCQRLAVYETLQPYFQTWRDFLRGEATELVNENTFSRTYEGHIGFKASHTEQSGWCLAEGATRNGMTCIAVVLNGTEDQRFADVKQLLKAGFSQYRVMQPLFSDEFLKPLTVKGGVSTAVRFTADDVHGVVVPKAEPDLTAVLQLPSYIEAPVQKGRKIGSVAFYNGDTMLYETALVTTEPVEAMTFSRAFAKITVKMLKF